MHGQRFHDQDGPIAHGMGVAVLRVRKLAATVRRAERHEHRQREVVVLVLTIPEGVADGCVRHARRPREQLLFVQLLLTTATLLP